MGCDATHAQTVECSACTNHRMQCNACTSHKVQCNAPIIGCNATHALTVGQHGRVGAPSRPRPPRGAAGAGGALSTQLPSQRRGLGICSESKPPAFRLTPPHHSTETAALVAWCSKAQGPMGTSPRHLHHSHKAAQPTAGPGSRGCFYPRCSRDGWGCSWHSTTSSTQIQTPSRGAVLCRRLGPCTWSWALCLGVARGPVTPHTEPPRGCGTEGAAPWGGRSGWFPQNRGQFCLNREEIRSQFNVRQRSAPSASHGAGAGQGRTPSTQCYQQLHIPSPTNPRPALTWGVGSGLRSGFCGQFG
ncbi:uncharacterized protein LOC110389081 [Numida meleagris]|uniref:uncharacterized protein LOC110389081 n=1 Tax=Numida meleagris TaxID=8996 RepID=UPI000B3DB483|nr:uncharacterized protein LOC110389081 [Numida meleagris]